MYACHTAGCALFTTGTRRQMSVTALCHSPTSRNALGHAYDGLALFLPFPPISFFLDLSRELRPDWFNLLGVAVLYCIISGVGRKKGIGFPVRWESAGWGYSKPSHFDGLLWVITLLLWGAGANQSFVTYGSL